MFGQGLSSVWNRLGGEEGSGVTPEAEASRVVGCRNAKPEGLAYPEAQAIRSKPGMEEA